jgi:hypothetical protein
MGFGSGPPGNPFWRPGFLLAVAAAAVVAAAVVAAAVVAAAVVAAAVVAAAVAAAAVAAAAVVAAAVVAAAVVAAAVVAATVAAAAVPQTNPLGHNVTLNGSTKILSGPPTVSEGSQGGRRFIFPRRSSSAALRCFTDPVSSMTVFGRPVQHDIVVGDPRLPP